MIEAPPDIKLRKRLFWIVFALGLGISISGFILEKIATYSLLDYRGIKFGSYGFNLAQIPPRKELGDKKVVVLFGNSVYQYGSIPSLMKDIIEEKGDPIVLMNMAQVSATAYDYLVQAGKIVDDRPDLVVFNLYYWTYFTTPKFATNCDQMVFDGDVIKVLPGSFYRRYFTFKTAFPAFISSVVPLKRLDPIIRWEFKLRDWLPGWFLKWVSYPHLNIDQERGELQYVQRSLLNVQQEKIVFSEILALQREFLNVLDQHHIPVLFIWQEASDDAQAEMFDVINQIIAEHKNAMWVDLRHYYEKDDFEDKIHPKRGKGVHDYAIRHYTAITQALEHFEKQRSPAQ
ncbi:MAG: hypothetical protein Q7S13_05055 [Candidatus Omnitrophota bacterium]|nr:hypothetical protein [Candidatus Omnitrophota bacterium]